MDDLLQRLPNWINGDRFNSFQRSIVEEVVGHFRDGQRLVLLDCPTGGGKSAIAEATRLSLDVRSTYLTHSLVLQDQLLGDFQDRVRTIKGRRNYLPQNTEPERGIVPSCADCDWDNRTELCTYCPHPPTCNYTVAKEVASMSPVVCSNYAYFLGETRGFHSILSGRGLTVLDEADMCESEILRHVSVDISPRQQETLGLRPPAKKTVEDSWPEWFDYAIPVVQRKLSTLPRTTLAEKRRRRAVKELLGKLQTIAEEPEGWIYDYNNGFISWKPITVDKLAPSLLWAHGQRFLAMSATIISPEEFVQSLGWDDSWAAVFAPSTFPVASRPINYVPVAPMVKKAEETSWPQMAAAVLAIMDRHPEERILVHCHSYKLTQHLYDAINQVSDRNVFAYFNSGEREKAISDFETFHHAVLLAPSLDRGYDGKDDKVRCIVICKVPYPYLGDKQVAARLYRTPSGQLWYDVQTGRSVVQMIGRGMRHEGDSCTGYVIDSMFGKFYSKWAVTTGNGNGSDEQGRGHQLFPNWFVEALDFNSDARFELRSAIREKREELKG